MVSVLFAQTDAVAAACLMSTREALHAGTR
jgi:hypothetical protein